MLGSRNPEQLIFSLIFPPELNVDGYFHTVEKSVQFCGNGSLITAKLSLSSVSFLYLASPTAEETQFPRDCPGILSAQEVSHAALPVLLEHLWTSLDEKSTKRSNNGQCHRSMDCTA